MKNLTEQIKANPKGVSRMLEKLGVSSPEVVERLSEREYPSRGDSSGCENTSWVQAWDSWSDAK